MACQVELVHEHVFFKVMAIIAFVHGSVEEIVDLTHHPVGKVEVQRLVGVWRIGTANS